MKRIWPGMLVALGGSVAFASPAKADVSAADRNVAQSLFDQAKDLMAAGKFADACPKLEESERLDPGGGTMINLALCHESEGRITTAWSDFKEALSFARRDGRADRAQACQEHIAALQPKLPRVTLTVTGAVQGEEINLDGAMMGPAVWGQPTPLDPGTHQLTANAPGRKPWQAPFDLAIGEQKALTIPALEADPAALAVAAAPPPSPAAPAGAPPPDNGESAKKRRMTGYIVGGAGVVALGVGTVFGIQALSKRSQSNDECPSDNQCTARGVSLNDDAKTAAWVADIGVGLGLVGIGVGTYLVLSSGSNKETSPAAQSTASNRLWVDANALPNGGRVTVGGAW